MPTNENPLNEAPMTPDEGEESHAYERLIAFIKQRTTPLQPRREDFIPAEPMAEPQPMMASDTSESAASEPELTEFNLPQNFRNRLINSYRERQQSAEMSPVGAFGEDIAPAAVLSAPANNWIPTGPSVMRKGQASNRPAVSGRLAGIAVARGGKRVYIASANGGVWRSDDGGLSWRSTMEAWDLDPTTDSSDSLACGAIALDLDDPDRIYVGTGEGDTVFIKGGKVTGTGAYFGVGPIRSDDGGRNWRQEPFAPGSQPTEGSAFYALAVDPKDRENVVGATIHGLYRREPDGSGGYHWARKRTGIFTSVVVTRGDGITVFSAAQWGGGVFFSFDGDKWDALGTGFPVPGAGRVGLAVQPLNPEVLYCLIERMSDHGTLGVWRFDAGSNAWKVVAGHPPQLLGNQGSYDLAIAVDPTEENLIYLGGASFRPPGGQYSASLYRCQVISSGSAYKMIPVYMGASVHADVHTLHFTPDERNSLWVGCDGGLFYNNEASGSDIFVQRNVGLATATMNKIGLHPTEHAVLFCGTQDNGTIRYTGEEVWFHSGAGDGGFVVINWNDPYKIVRTYVQGIMYGTTDGGQSYNSWNKNVSIPLDLKRAEFYAPLAGTPYNPAAPAEADILAFGGMRPWLSHNFGDAWQSIPNNDQTDELGFPITALMFASATRLYVGTNTREATDENGQLVTIGGEVYRFDLSNNHWTRTRISATPLLVGPITSIAVDPSDQSGDSIYLTLGGIGDYRHVWHYDGSTWEERSGPPHTSPDSLLDVQHNVVVIDPLNTGNLYVGADIGVWRSTDSGATWATFVNGLPDAAVLDLKIFEPQRLLFASTHGRGVFERILDSDTAPGTELYIRDTQLDLRRFPSAYGAPDPTIFGSRVKAGASPDIKVDVPTASGVYQSPSNRINFFEFVDTIEDRSDAVTALDSTVGTVNHRVYVQVHNRGVVPAADIRVMLLLAPASNGIPSLPNAYEVNVQNGTPINNPQWKTVDVQTIDEIQIGSPKVASFDLPSSMLLPPAAPAVGAEYVLLALIHCSLDEFLNNERQVSALGINERKATYKLINVR
ncbi:MAG: hypothetical protein QOH63_17 [Acidobacteriota bacterium]|jgi:photosystem II stability/assembly factor-like uncharacterized protein|nr:hypothetical protein [Acidobacteriota bacterium]